MFLKFKTKIENHKLVQILWSDANISDLDLVFFYF